MIFTSTNSLIYDLTVQGCQWMPIGMIEKRLKKDLSENLIAVDRQAKSSKRSLLNHQKDHYKFKLIAPRGFEPLSPP